MSNEMRSYQRRALQELHDGERALFLPYGTGKSWVALQYALEDARRRDIAVRGVIFCKNRNVHTWQKELSKRCAEWGNSPITVFALGDPKTREMIYKEAIYRANSTQERAQHMFLVIPYTILQRLMSAMYGMIMSSLYYFRPTILIGDESTTVKNPSTNVTKSMLLLSTEFKHIPKVILTGNPKPEHEKEIWSQIAFTKDLTAKERRETQNSFYGFLRYWFIKSDYGYVLNLEKHEAYYDTLGRTGVWLTEAEKLELKAQQALPTSLYTMEFYKVSKQQRVLLEKLQEDWALPTEQGEMEFNYAISVAQKAQQICSGFYYTDTGEAEQIMLDKHNPKLQLLIETVKELLLEQSGRKLIVWRKYKYEIELLRRNLESYGCVIGPDAEALEAFESDPNVRCIVMPIDCSEGFNDLAVANTNIFFSNDFSQNKRNQAEARIIRLNQLACYVTHIDIVGDSMRDLEVATALQAKALTSERLQTIINKYSTTEF